MSRIIMGILILILLAILFLLFWIIILSIALFLVRKSIKKGKGLSNREITLHLEGGA